MTYRSTDLTNPTWGKNDLDLFVTTNDRLIIKTQVIPPISDYDAVFFYGNIKATINRQKRRMILLYRKVDWGGFKEHMPKNVDSVVHSTDYDLSTTELSSFREESTSGIKRFIPHRFTS